jgi:gamma-glutamylcyclotransferase (GGCT)/AIG2-like uncharacterized protein YtfP
VLDPGGAEIEVLVFASADLPAHWARLDAFEGEGYQRVSAKVATDAGDVDACVFVLADEVKESGRPRRNGP